MKKGRMEYGEKQRLLLPVGTRVEIERINSPRPKPGREQKRRKSLRFSNQRLSNLSKNQKYLFQHRLLDPTPRVSGLVGPEGSPKSFHI